MDAVRRVSLGIGVVGRAFLRISLWILAVAIVLLLVLHPLLPDTISVPVSQLGTVTLLLRDPFRLLWSEIVAPCAAFLNQHFDKVLAWPVAAVVMVYLLLRSGVLPAVLPSAMGRVRTLNLFGFKLELSEQITEIARERDDLSKALSSVRAKIEAQLRVKVVEANIPQNFARFVSDVGSELKGRNTNFDGAKCRATIYIEDPIFAGQLMQLLEYVSGDGTPLPGLAAGRSFSIRRGIVGRVWRSHLPEIEGVLPDNLATVEPQDKYKYIARIWGMTQLEAEHAAKYPSYISVPFEYTPTRCGVFYMDSTMENAFTNEDNKAGLIMFIQQKVKELRLDGAIGELNASLAASRLQIPLLEPLDAK